MKNFLLIIAILSFICITPNSELIAQENDFISVWQYRRVPADKIDEFIHRETTYWKEVAQNAINDGNMQFWGLFQKMGEVDMEESSNFVFVNTFKDIDAANGIWNPAEVFPNTSISAMETNSMSTVTSQIYTNPRNFVGSDAVPSESYNYVKVNYWNSTDPDAFIELENEHWAPFIKDAMAKDGTSQVAWGNHMILSPQGENIGSNTMSVDLYPSLKSALMPKMAEGVELPEELFEKLDEIRDGTGGSVVYRIVAVATSDNN